MSFGISFMPLIGKKEKKMNERVPIGSLRVLANLGIFLGIFLGISMENGAGWLERWISTKLSGISLKLSRISISQAS